MNDDAQGLKWFSLVNGQGLEWSSREDLQWYSYHFRPCVWIALRVTDFRFLIVGRILDTRSDELLFGRGWHFGSLVKLLLRRRRGILGPKLSPQKLTAVQKMLRKPKKTYCFTSSCCVHSFGFPFSWQHGATIVYCFQDSFALSLRSNLICMQDKCLW